MSLLKITTYNDFTYEDYTYYDFTDNINNRDITYIFLFTVIGKVVYK